MSIKCLSFLAACVASIAISASAQHGGAHGTIGGHSAPSMGGLGGGASRGFTGSPRLTGFRQVYPGAGFRSGTSGMPMRRPGGIGPGGYRHPYTGGYRPHGLYTGYPWTGVGGVAFLGYPDTLGLDDGTAGYGNEASYGDPSQGPYTAAPYPDTSADAVLPPYPQYPQPVPTDTPPRQIPAPEPAPEEAVTLIFKDGRPAEQIHNYMLTRTTLYVRDQHHSEIPVSDLDVAATTRANKAAGVDFQLLPQGSQ